MEPVWDVVRRVTMSASAAPRKRRREGKSSGGSNPNAAAGGSRGKNASSDKQAGILRRYTAASGGIRVQSSVPAESHSNGDERGYELFYGMKSDMGHVHAFGCVVRVVLPSQVLGKLDDRAAMH